MNLTPCKINKLNGHYDKAVVKICPVYVFYHIYCGSNDWKGIVDEQLQMMKISGLWSEMDKLFVTIIGSDSDIADVMAMLAGTNFEVVYSSDDGSCFEFPCLIKMRQLAKSEKFYALYFHTKGASYSRIRHDWSSCNYEWKLVQVARWRNLMNYYCLYKWNMAINALSDNYEAYGILQRDMPKPHFSGNFWWARSELISNTPVIDRIFKEDRYNAEFWIMWGGVIH